MEDEPFLSKIVRESLESRGFEVYWTGDGLEALPTFERSVNHHPQRVQRQARTLRKVPA